jgi:hypothetical protein
MTGLISQEARAEGLIGVHHYGMAVPNIEKFLEFSFYQVSGEIVEDPKQGSRLCLANPAGIAGPPWVELIEPLAEGTPVWKAVAERGAHWHHVCLEFAARAHADAFRAAHRMLSVSPWTPTVLFSGLPVTFAWTRNRELVEFLAHAG